MDYTVRVVVVEDNETRNLIRSAVNEICARTNVCFPVERIDAAVAIMVSLNPTWRGIPYDYMALLAVSWIRSYMVEYHNDGSTDEICINSRKCLRGDEVPKTLRTTLRTVYEKLMAGHSHPSTSDRAPDP